MMRIRAAAAAVATLALTTTACSAQASGHGSTAPTTRAAAASTSAGAPTTSDAPSATSGPPTTPDATTPSAGTSETPHASGGDPTLTQPAQLRCAGSPERVTDCLSNSLAAYWSDHAPHNRQADQVVYLQIPTGSSECADAARTNGTPFTCTADLGELYFPPSFQRKLAQWFSATDLPYAYASVLSHEFGHYLQLDVHDPAVSDRNKTAAQTKVVEQQADCLSGVWVHDAATNHGFDAGRFNAVAMDLIRRVSSNSEISTHGTPDERFAALDRGLGTGRPSACGLAGLH